MVNNNAAGRDYGIFLSYSGGNALANNSVTGSDYGIYLGTSGSNTLTNNNATGNSRGGFRLSSSTSNTLTGNNATNNSGFGFLVDWSSDYNILTGNNVIGNSGYGIEIYSANNNKLIQNNVLSNSYGLRIMRSANYNTLTRNNLIDNINYNVYDTVGSNSWVFNYYSDYTGSDSNNDGIGDTTYYIAGDVGAKDSFPIMQPMSANGVGASFTLYTGGVIPLYEGYSLRFLHVNNEGKAIFENQKDGSVVSTNAVNEGDLFSYTKSIGGSNRLILYGMLKNVFQGTERGVVDITTFYQISEIGGIVLIDDSSDLPNPVPLISLSSPSSASVSNTTGDSQTFIATVDQIANITWILDGVILYTNTSVTTASYNNISAQAGEYNVTVLAENANGTDQKNWTWTVAASPAPTISLSSPSSALVSNTAGDSRIFTATIDQIANVTWILDGAILHTNTSVTTASYHNSSAQAGVHNLTVVAKNANGTDQKKWTWGVAAPSDISTAISPMDSGQSVVLSPDDIRINIVEINPFYVRINVTSTTNPTGSIRTIGTGDTGDFLNPIDTPSGTIKRIDVSVYGDSAAMTIYSNFELTIVDYLDAPVPETPTVPSITSFSPFTLSVSDSTGNPRTFTVTIDQIVNLTWILDGIPLYTNTSATTASYHNSSAQAGVHNVTVVAENVNGTGKKEWAWTVTTPNTYTMTLLKGWNLVSIPITPDTPDTSSVFGSNSDVILPIYEWNTAGRQYYDASTIETGKGYWILALNDTQVVITGTL